MTMRQDMIQLLGFIGIAAACVLSAFANSPGQKPRAIEVGRKLELFLHDDHFIAERSGVTLVSAKVEKSERNPVLVLDQPWEKDYYMTGCSVLHDVEEKMYKIWYDVRNTLATDPNLQDGVLGRCLYATSKDGLNWTKPILNVVSWKGSTANNVVFIGPEGRRSNAYSVVKDYSEHDPARRYKMLFHCWDFRGRGVSIATSPDGIRWTARPYTNMIGGFDTLNVMLFDDRIGAFTCYLRNWVGDRRHVARATSYDGFHWSNPVTVLGPDHRDPPTVDIYAGSVIKLKSATDAYVMLPVAYEQRNDTSASQLALSRDGIGWHRIVAPFIPLGNKGEWDAGLTWSVGGDVLIGDKTALFYRGNSMAHGKPGNRGRTGVGVALLRQVGFVGWRGESEGVITTKPLLVSHRRFMFYLNVDAEGGAVQAEILDSTGKVIPGFSRADSKAVKSNGMKVSLKWEKESSKLGDYIRQGPLQLRLFLKKATIYGFGATDVSPEEE